jgi:hypothetical protein
MSGTFDLASLGTTGQTVLQAVASQAQNASMGIYLGRILIRPFMTIGILVVIILILMFGFKQRIASFVVIGICVAFIVLKFVPNPFWSYTKPLETALYTIEPIEEATGLNINEILNQVASGVTVIGNKMDSVSSTIVNQSTQLPFASAIPQQQQSYNAPQLPFASAIPQQQQSYNTPQPYNTPQSYNTPQPQQYTTQPQQYAPQPQQYAPQPPYAVSPQMQPQYSTKQMAATATTAAAMTVQPYAEKAFAASAPYIENALNKADPYVQNAMNTYNQFQNSDSKIESAVQIADKAKTTFANNKQVFQEAASVFKNLLKKKK